MKLGLYGNDPCLVHLNIPALEISRVSYYEAESEREVKIWLVVNVKS